MRGDLPRVSLSSKKRTKLHSFRLPMSGVCRPHSQKNLNESEFVVDSGVSPHMISRKDPNSAELSPLRASKSPTKMVTANGELQTKGKTTVDVRELDLFVTVMLLQKYTGSSLGKFCEDHGYNYHWTSGQKPHLFKMAERNNAARRTTYQSLLLFYRRALQAHLHLHLLHLHRRKPKLPQPFQQEVRARVRTYEENFSRVDQQKPKTRTKMTTTRKHEETRPMICQIPAAKAAVDKECEKLEKISEWNLTKVRSKKQVIDEARTKGVKVHFASLMDICHLKNAELESKHHKYKGRVVFRGDIVEEDSGSYAVFTEQGSSASQMTAAKVMDIISRLPGCAGQAADAVSAHTQVKMEDAPKLLKIFQKSECPDIWIRLPRHKWPKS